MKHRVYAHELFLGLEDIDGLADVALVSVGGVLTDVQMLGIVIRILGGAGNKVGIVRIEAGPPCDYVGHVIVELYVHYGLLGLVLNNCNAIYSLLQEVFNLSLLHSQKKNSFSLGLPIAPETHRDPPPRVFTRDLLAQNNLPHLN